MSESEPWTIGRLLTWTTTYLKDRGAENPRLDAEVLLADSRQCRRIELYTSFEDIPSDEVRQRFRELVRRRAEGMPVAYLVGRKEFYSHSFRVTRDVLIPRPETELLLIRLLDLIARDFSNHDHTIAVADVGTGSGILAVCTAMKYSNARVTAIDLSEAAIEVARMNAVEHGVTDRIEFVRGDLLTGEQDQTFDFVVSNPPYVSTAEMQQLPRDVRDYEPHQALEAGEHGTEVIERLIPQAAARLRPGGWFLVEISPMIAEEVRRLLDKSESFQDVTTTKDLAGLARVVQARRK